MLQLFNMLVKNLDEQARQSSSAFKIKRLFCRTVRHYDYESDKKIQHNRAMPAVKALYASGPPPSSRHNENDRQ
jgi:hypothetical protein